MSELKEIMKQGREFIAANLAECCRDELDWQDSSLLRNGKLCEAASIFAKVDQTYAIPMAQSETARQAMRLVAHQTAAAPVSGDVALPELPTPDHALDMGMQPFYRPDQMHAYARTYGQQCSDAALDSVISMIEHQINVENMNASGHGARLRIVAAIRALKGGTHV